MTNKTKIALFLSLIVFAKMAVGDEILKKTLAKYSAKPFIKLSVTKTDEKPSVSIKKVSTGFVTIGKNKINVTLKSDKKAELIYNGKKAWLVDYPDTDFNPKAGRKVIEFGSDQPDLIKKFLTLFSSYDNFIKVFSITETKQNKNHQEYVLKSKNELIKDINIKINQKSLLIEEISFSDDIQTKVVIDIKKTEFPKAISSSKFNFKLLSKDEVISQ